MLDNLRLDAAETVFFQRELEQISAENFDIRYAELKGLLLVPVDRSIDPAAELWTYRQFDSTGKAARIADYSADFPAVDVKGVEYSQKIVSYGDSFHYSIPEIRAAAKVGRPLDRMRAMTARDVLAQQLDTIACVGDGSDLAGLANLSGTSTYSVPATGTGSSKHWSAKTPDQVLTDLNGMVTQVVSTTKEVERPRRIVLPTAQYELIKNTARSANSDTTILQYFKDNNPGVEVMSWERLAGLGASGTDRAIAYDPSPNKVRLLLPIPFEQMAPEQRNMSFKINCHMRTGGVITPYPLSICYADGI